VNITLFLVGALLAYLLGSLPSAVWYGKAFFGIDVREHGSGNAGATNTFRVLGSKAGIVVMLLDVLKGWTATSMAYILVYLGYVPLEYVMAFQLTYGIIAVLGHIFPVYVGFKGGKGVATLLGMVLSIHTQAALICMIIFLVVFLLSHYVSLGSMIAALSFPLIMLIPRFSPDEPLTIIFGFIIFAIVVLTHQKNIVRLINGQESKIHINLKKNKK